MEIHVGVLRCLIKDDNYTENSLFVVKAFVWYISQRSPVHVLVLSKTIHRYIGRLYPHQIELSCNGGNNSLDCDSTYWERLRLTTPVTTMVVNVSVDSVCNAGAFTGLRELTVMGTVQGRDVYL